MAPWRDLTAAGSAALDALAVLAAMRGENALALAVHGMACAALAHGLHRRFGGGAAAWTLVFLLSLFLPVAGAVGLVTAAWVKSVPDDSPGPELIRTRVPGALEAIAPAPESRDAGEQVAAARGQSFPASIALLRRALGNPNEDVRLIAHAVLESKSRAAYRGIHEATAALEAAPAERRAVLHQRLAAQHWELVWLGLADGESLDPVLETARSHALDALQADPDRASLHFLLARIELRRGSPRNAEAALLRAVQLGLPRATAQPYLAESAFLARRFERLRQHLAAWVPDRGNTAMDRVRRYWT
jgi:hypothetical protein